MDSPITRSRAIQELRCRRCGCGGGDFRKAGLGLCLKIALVAGVLSRSPLKKRQRLCVRRSILNRADATDWSVRATAASHKVSPATVQRIWKKHQLQKIPGGIRGRRVTG